MSAIEFRYRHAPAGALVRHAILEDAAASFCGADRSILAEVRPGQVRPVAAVNCGACMANVRRAAETRRFAARIRP